MTNAIQPSFATNDLPPLLQRVEKVHDLVAKGTKQFPNEPALPKILAQSEIYKAFLADIMAQRLDLSSPEIQEGLQLTSEHCSHFEKQLHSS